MASNTNFHIESEVHLELEIRFIGVNKAKTKLFLLHFWSYNSAIKKKERKRRKADIFSQ